MAVFTYLTGHESLPVPGGPKSKTTLTCLQRKRFLICRERFFGCTYLFGGP